jgi:hypothetical protein
LAVINKHSIEKLFEGCEMSIPPQKYVLVAANNGGVVDYYEQKIENIELKDVNIGYLGRLNKGYFKRILADVIEFANENESLLMQFIVVGTGADAEIDNLSRQVPYNLEILFLGEFIPIPKSLFSKIDVMIAGSGCAIISVNQGIITIIPDANTFDAIGIYGYTTDSFLYGNDTKYTYKDYLQQIFIEKKYLNCRNEYSYSISAEDEYKKHFEFLKESSDDMAYFEMKKRRYVKMKPREIVKIIFSNIFGTDLVKNIYMKRHAYRHDC